LVLLVSQHHFCEQRQAALRTSPLDRSHWMFVAG
jgi:hypothetical protein